MLDAFASVGAPPSISPSRGAAKRRKHFGAASGSPISARYAVDPRPRHAQRAQRYRAPASAPAFVSFSSTTSKPTCSRGSPPPCFSFFKTSPANFQAWVAVAGAEDKDFARRLRKGAGADATASGATRVAGSLNFKDKYAPEFPRVKIEQATPGRKATHAELDQLGLVAAPRPRRAPPLLADLHRQPARMARLWSLPEWRADEPRQDRTRCKPRRFSLVQDRHSMGMERRRDRHASDGVEPEGAGARGGMPYAVRTAEAAALAVARENSPASRSPYPAPKQG